MKKIVKIGGLVLTACFLSSCTLLYPFVVDDYQQIINPLDPLEKSTSHKSDYQKIMFDGEIQSCLPSLGTPHILVVPIEFSDYTFGRKGLSNEAAKEKINDAFFGERTNSPVESLASYYEESSYGQLHIKGSVTDVYRAPRTYREYSKITDDDQYLRAVDTIISNFLNDYDPVINFTDYDTDSDGFIDAIWLVYSAPVNDDMFWAYTSWLSGQKTHDGVKASSYSFASYDFFDEGGYIDHPDMHTFIHETGHLLGLDDYYNYDSSTSHPCGCLDMMDYNIGDHMAFSKYNLGWIDPQVITENGNYTLKPLVSGKEAYIIPAHGYNNSVFWEYYIIEYYTPEGLNKLDSETRYSNYTYPLMFGASGLRVYHVNQKLGYLNSNYVWDRSYISDIGSLDKERNYAIINSNTPSHSYTGKATTRNMLVKLISPVNFNYGRAASNDDLFSKVGSNNQNIRDQFEGENSSIGFTFTVSEIDAEKISFNYQIV